MKFTQAPFPPKDLRTAYLDSLTEPQEFFVEILVASGRTWVFGNIAYAVTNGQRMVEFYVASDAAKRAVELFDAVMLASGASSVLCKSFDSMLLNVALSRRADVTSGGLLFRKIIDSDFVTREELSFRAGSSSDVDLIWGFHDGFFEDRAEIMMYADSQGLFLLEKEGEVVGCGTGKQVFTSRIDVDIGMLVASKHRKKGYGSYIAAFLKNHYLLKNLRPICGCSIDNVGSWLALNNAGFVSEHRLLNISYSF